MIDRSSACRVPPFGLNRTSFVRPAEGSSRTVVLGDLGVEIEGRPLGAPLRLAPVLPRPAPQPRPAVSRRAPPCQASPVECPGFGFDRFTVNWAPQSFCCWDYRALFEAFQELSNSEPEHIFGWGDVRLGRDRAGPF